MEKRRLLGVLPIYLSQLSLCFAVLACARPPSLAARISPNRRISQNRLIRFINQLINEESSFLLVSTNNSSTPLTIGVGRKSKLKISSAKAVHGKVGSQAHSASISSRQSVLRFIIDVISRTARSSRKRSMPYACALCGCRMGVGFRIGVMLCRFRFVSTRGMCGCVCFRFAYIRS